MSIVQPTITEVRQPGFGVAGWLVQWANMKNGDTGAVVDLHCYADRSIQAEGTFGTGGTLVCEGSNDGTNYRTLKDHTGVSASITTADVVGISQLPLWIRPRVAAGDGTTNLTASLFLRRTLS